MNYKSILLLTFLIISNPATVNAYQKNENDVIKKIDSLNALSWQLKQNDISYSFQLANEASELSEQIGYKRGTQLSLKSLAVLHIFKGKYDSALILSKIFLSLSKEVSDSAEIANAYNIIGSINYHKGEFEEGISYYLKALKLKEELNDLIGVGKLYNNISTIYLGQNKFKKSLEYNFKSVKTKELLKDSIGLANSYNNLGFTYQKLSRFDSALFYTKKGLKIAINSEDNLLMTGLYSNTGEIYLELNELDSALDMFQKSIQISTGLQEKRILIYAYIGTGKVYIAKKQFKKALPYLIKANQLALSIGVKKEIANSFEELSHVFINLKNFEQAYESRIQYEIYKDSLINEENNKVVEELERTYNYEKQQAEIHQFEIENKYQEAQFLRQRRIGAVLVLLLIIMGGLAFSLVRNNRAKKVAIQELEQRNKEVTAKNIEIEKQQENIRYKNELLDAKNKKLLQLDEEKNHLVSIVAHDLRSPLANIMGLVGILDLDGNMNEKQKGFIEKINQSAEKLNEMISNVLSKDNIKQAELEIELKPLSITSLIDETIETLEQSALQKNIAIRVNEIANLPLILADSNFGLQVLTNLVSNAIKFSPPNKKIFIKARADQSMIYVYVKDEGPGLSEEDKKSLFGRYQRLSAKPTAGESSTGLGLSIVKEYMELMGGVVECNSSKGEGAEFIVGFELA